MNCKYFEMGGCGLDLAFLHWHQVFMGLKSQYTQMKTNQDITLVKMCICEVTDKFLLFFKSQEVQYLKKKKKFLHSVNVKKIALEYTIYSIKNIKNLSG